jgi:hypothetical protein
VKKLLRYKGTEKQIIKNYSESIHGKGLLKRFDCSATCTAAILLKELHTDPLSSINPSNIPGNMWQLHSDSRQFEKSIHSSLVSKSDKNFNVRKHRQVLIKLGQIQRI